MKRRSFLTLLVGASTAWPIAARAQQPAVPVIGFLHQGSPETYVRMQTAFLQGLKETGYASGENVAIEYRWANGQYDRLPSLAAELVRRQVDVISTALLPAAEAAKAATKTIPIVFNIGSDPVKVGLVASFTRPGGNLTGFSRLTAELGPKRLELLREMVPSATVIAFLVNPTNPNSQALISDAQAAARALGVQLPVFTASNEHHIDDAFAALLKRRAGGLLIAGDTFLNDRGPQISALAARHSIPTIYSNTATSVGAAGLMSYGANLTDVDRQFGVYTGRVLKGEKPADLPVQQSTKVELIINLKTAKALGLSVPLSLLGRADEVIE